jgi:type VI secretion system protein ImpL
MAKDSSVWRGNWGRLSITTLIAVAIGLVIWKKGDAFGLTSNGLKAAGICGAIILLLLARHGKTISLAILQQWSRLQAKRKNVLPVDEGQADSTTQCHR